ncbi:unnamed protein product [Candida verbasci]|uniref:PH domain-containing protein n=1 Tax=Candida verbasci TaxID=1227364 RepID=A0A9W4U077_9ASCO|nr:unnamed protein product [Candida verbasci]
MESSRSINHKLNELLSKNNSNKFKLERQISLTYGSILKQNILGINKQEKVNSIVVLAKLLDCIESTNEFNNILDHGLFSTLFSIISSNMSTETYKAILKICTILVSGNIFETEKIEFYLPLFDSLVDYLDVIEIITTKLFLQDNKITLNSIKLVYNLINKCLDFNYTGIITLSGHLKHVNFFNTIGNLLETNDALILSSIDELKISYYNLNMNLNSTKFDLSIKSHQIMLNHLFIFLEVSLNEYGTPATIDEYIKAGFTDNPRQFVIENFTILLAMDLKIFLKDPNFTFKKRFHEELMMSDHTRTFPLYLFIEKSTQLWISIFTQRETYPFIYNSILSWELFIYSTMNNCLILWQQTKAKLNNVDINKIFELLYSNLNSIEYKISSDLPIDECLEIDENIRRIQVESIKLNLNNQWNSEINEFDKLLVQKVTEFVLEQRVIQLLKGSWVFTESFGESLFKNSKSSSSSSSNYKYYYIILAPNRNFIYYKEFTEKPKNNPNFEEMEEKKIKISDIHDLKSIRIGSAIGEDDIKKNSMLISIKGTISYEKITLFDINSKKLLSFYTDNINKKLIIQDGIKMLKKDNSLSEETTSQINTLIEIRRTTQLIPLENEINIPNKEDDDVDDDDDIYNFDELNRISNDFNYVN